MGKRDDIFKILSEKGCMKQEVYRNTTFAVKMMKSYLESLTEDLKKRMSEIDKNVLVEFEERGDFELRLKLGGDILIFLMHSNVFDFEDSHAMYKTGYIKEERYRSYCGMISIYNFLADSFKYNREGDLGYLIGRMFVNKDNHCFVEGKKKLGFMYNDFANQKVTRELIGKIIDSAILYSMSFDLLTPPYRHVMEVSVQEVNSVSQASRMRTGKRLGFQFKSTTKTKA
ncbi:MAG TPA: hypothetical protein DCX54_01485 [Flavobacteriales bacterium]|nr:hypothetical protein [Flavobacteriales bacterium]